MRSVTCCVSRTARSSLQEERAALVNCKTFVMIPFVILQSSIRVSSPCTEGNERVVCATACAQEKQALIYRSVFYTNDWPA
jgi:hypothetical protein